VSGQEAREGGGVPEGEKGSRRMGKTENGSHRGRVPKIRSLRGGEVPLESLGHRNRNTLESSRRGSNQLKKQLYPASFAKDGGGQSEKRALLVSGRQKVVAGSSLARRTQSRRNDLRFNRTRGCCWAQ